MLFFSASSGHSMVLGPWPEFFPKTLELVFVFCVYIFLYSVSPEAKESSSPSAQLPYFLSDLGPTSIQGPALCSLERPDSQPGADPAGITVGGFRRTHSFPTWARAHHPGPHRHFPALDCSVSQARSLGLPSLSRFQPSNPEGREHHPHPSCSSSVMYMLTGACWGPRLFHWHPQPSKGCPDRQVGRTGDLVSEDLDSSFNSAPAVRPWENTLLSLSLSFITYKMTGVIPSISWACFEGQMR